MPSANHSSALQKHKHARREIKLFFSPALSDNAARMTVTCFTTSFLVFKPADWLCVSLPCDFACENRRGSAHAQHRQMASRFQDVFVSSVLERDKDDQWGGGDRSNVMFNLNVYSFKPVYKMIIQYIILSKAVCSGFSQAGSTDQGEWTITSTQADLCRVFFQLFSV